VYHRSWPRPNAASTCAKRSSPGPGKNQDTRGWTPRRPRRIASQDTVGLYSRPAIPHLLGTRPRLKPRAQSSTPLRGLLLDRSSNVLPASPRNLPCACRIAGSSRQPWGSAHGLGSPGSPGSDPLAYYTPARLPEPGDTVERAGSRPRHRLAACRRALRAGIGRSRHPWHPGPAGPARFLPLPATRGILSAGCTGDGPGGGGLCRMDWRYSSPLATSSR
jgi:hypothetical protein